eukprot:TRINITY_DN67450_c7_g2_i1.p1 TRINITY_DN67450_c7_g2~~TRINITY_DN67450_c7_g2_i1.p1  ORF type:complete len:271 (-),score=24.88 TRINITY_DN67450_c7_g2_i1:92-904(-)
MFLTDSRSAPSRREIEGVSSGLQLLNVLQPENCEHAITFAEQLGFDNATHPNYQDKWIDKKEKNYRKNDRCVYEATEREVEWLYDALKDHCAQNISEPGWGSWDIWGINEMWRIYKYQPGQWFPVHKDNTTVKTKALMSWVTVLVYLSEGFEGGGTAFCESVYEKPHTVIQPIQGSVVMFNHTGKHSPWHIGLPHTSEGKVKYVLRTDVMYQCNEMCPPIDLPLSAPFDEKLYVYPKYKQPPPEWYVAEMGRLATEESDSSGEEEVETLV